MKQLNPIHLTDSENWGCELELVPWDGYYVVEFTATGEVVDAAAMF